MAVAPDTSTAVGSGGTPSAVETISFTCSGSNRVLWVSAQIDRTVSSASVLSVTFNGVPLRIVRDSTDDNQRLEAWFMASPDAVTANVVVTFSAACGHVVTVQSYTGSDGTYGTPIVTVGNDTAPTATVDSAAGDMVADVVAVAGSATITAGAGETLHGSPASFTSPVTGYSASGHQSGAASVTPAYSLSVAAPWALIAFPLHAGTQTAVGGRRFQGVADVQEFTSSGTWTKPDGAVLVLVALLGGGGGGQGAERGVNGYGGGGGGAQVVQMLASSLPATVTVTLGTGGAGSAGTTSTLPAAGSNGTATTFGSYLTAGGGPGGTSAGVLGGLGSTTGAVPRGTGNGDDNGLAGPGGGPGGKNAAAGGNGGNTTTGATDGGAGGAGGVSPAAGSNGATTHSPYAGGGGGGGGASNTTAVVGGNGGNGGPGAGGGGGGMSHSVDGGTGGSGGTGGNGYAIITSI